MTKRSNPFDDFPPIQLKTHVSSKHVATKDDMEEVYKKTWARMKAGAKLAFSNGADTSDQHGTLANGTSPVPPNGATPTEYCNGVHKAESPQKAHCRLCKSRTEGRRCLLCTYCQLPSCADTCVSECGGCQRVFCQFCTVLNYDKPGTRVFCMDCLEQFTWD